MVIKKVWFVIKKLKNTAPWTYVFNDFNGEEIIGTFYEKEKEVQKTNQKGLIIEKVIKRKADKLYFKWKGYDNSFNSWIDKKRFSVILLIIISLYKRSHYFSKPYEPFVEDTNVNGRY